MEHDYVFDETLTLADLIEIEMCERIFDGDMIAVVWC